MKTSILIALVAGLVILGGCTGLSGGVEAQSQDDLDREVQRVANYAAILTKTADDAGVGANVSLTMRDQPANVYAKQEFGLELPFSWQIIAAFSSQPRHLLNELAQPDTTAPSTE